MQQVHLLPPLNQLVVGVLATLASMLACGQVLTPSIQVRCVYESSGQGTPGVVVNLVPYDYSGPLVKGSQARTQSATSDGTVCFEGFPFGKYDVTVVNPLSAYHLMRFGSSRFRTLATLPRQSVRLSARDPRADVTLSSNKGATLEGRVTRRDGSPLGGIVVAVVGRNSGEEVARGITDDRGRYILSGLPLGTPAGLRIISTRYIQCTPDILGRVRSVVGRPYVLWQQDVDLREIRNHVDVRVPTMSLDIAINVLQPIWPFPAERRLVVGVWVDGTTSSARGLPHVRFDLGYGTRTVTTRWCRERHRVLLRDMPVGQDVTVALGAFVQDTGSVPRVVPDYHLLKQIETHLGVGKTEFAIHAPYAVMSRLLWLGAALITIGSCVIALAHRHLRKRAGLPESTAPQ